MVLEDSFGVDFEIRSCCYDLKFGVYFREEVVEDCCEEVMEASSEK